MFSRLLTTIGLLAAVTAAVRAAEPTPLDAKVADGLRAAMTRGAAIYNGGDSAGCCRFFEGALTALKPLLDHRPELQKAIDTGVAAAQTEPAAAERAFRLRAVLDAALKAVSPPKTDAAKGGFQVSKEEQEILDLTNKERKDAGLPSLTANPKLFAAARAHATNMAKQDKLAHTLDDQDAAARIKAAGYESAGWGENVAAGQRTPADVIASWMKSELHKANILGTHTEVGIGVSVSETGTKYYTQVFASPKK
jgi:uncharacterized protein YkwD